MKLHISYVQIQDKPKVKLVRKTASDASPPVKKEKDKEKEKEVKTSSKKVTRTTSYLDLGRILLFVLKKNMDEVEEFMLKAVKMVVNPLNPRIKI